MKHIRVIIAKEWAEVFKNKMVLFTIVLMPVLFTALPLIMCVPRPERIGRRRHHRRTRPVCPVMRTMNSNDCMQIYLINQFLVLNMMMPLIIP